MKIAIALRQMIGPYVNGSQVTCWAIVQNLLRQGYEVHVCSILEQGEVRSLQAEIAKLESTGAKFSPIVFEQALLSDSRPKASGGLASRIKDFLYLGSAEDHVPSLKFRALAAEKFRQIGPDAIFCYDVHSLCATMGLHIAPKLGLVGDLWHLNTLLHWKVKRKGIPWPRRLKRAIGVHRSASLLKRVMLDIVRDCDQNIEFAAHHADWFHQNGVANMMYLPTPVEDPLPECVSVSRLQSLTKPRILMIGDLQNLSSRLGLQLFVDEILPELERRFGRDGFEARVVGGGRLPPHILEKLEGHPAIKMVGHVSPPHQEFLSADVVMVPTPEKIGIRVRILVAFGYGCCVVSHEDNASGIPEMKHNFNALIGTSGVELAAHIEAAWKNKTQTAELRRNARATFEEKFTADKAAGRLTDELLRLTKCSRAGS